MEKGCKNKSNLSVYFHVENEYLLFGNTKIEVVFDKKTGLLRCIQNKLNGFLHNFIRTGSSLIGLSVRENSQAQVQKLSANEGLRIKYDMSYNSESSILILLYHNFGGENIDVRLSVELYDDSEYFLIGADIKNNSQFEITDIWFGLSNLKFDIESTVMALPNLYFGHLEKLSDIDFSLANPGKTVFGHPGQSVDGLASSWIDFYDQKGGVGIGYIDKQGLPVKLELSGSQENFSVAWHNFDLSETRLGGDTTGPHLTHMPDDEYTGIFSLEPDTSFQTGNFILALHRGDWHSMADTYRQEYEKVYKDDFLDWKKTSNLAKEIDVFIHYLMFRDGELVKRFNEVFPEVKAIAEECGVEPKNLMVWIGGQGVCGHDQRNPDFFPANAEAGGQSEMNKMMDDLKSFGINAVMYYTHPYTTDPNATYHVREADLGKPLVWTGNKLGNHVCTYCQTWLDMWKNNLCKDLNEIGATGVQLDQSPQQFMICDKSDHLHTADTLGRLSAHSKGINKIVRILKENSNFPEFFIMSEAGNDVLTRNMDIWQYHVVNHPEIIRYQFPYRLMLSYGDTNTVEGVNKRLIDGVMIGIYSKVNNGKNWYETGIEPEMSFNDCKNRLIDAYRQTVKIRRELREKKAPGFPYGYRHNSGVCVKDNKLNVRIYSDNFGVTLLYYASNNVTTEITFDLNVFGVGKEKIVHKVSLIKDQAGYFIYNI